MIPDTLVGLAIFAATVAPGRIYERRAEQRAPRPERSPFAELVELVVIGEMATVSAALMVALVAQLTTAIDVGALIEDPSGYTARETARVLIGGIATLAVSYAVAELAARRIYPIVSAEQRRRTGGFTPQPIWYEVLWEDRPSNEHSAVATIELKNGFRITGQIAHFTAEGVENRELALREPIVMRPPGGPTTRFEGGHYALVREEEIRFIAGRYVAPP